MKLISMEPFFTFSLMGISVILIHSSLFVDSLSLVHLSPAPSPVTSRRREDPPPPIHSHPRFPNNRPAEPPHPNHNLHSRQGDHRGPWSPDHKKTNLGKKIGVLFIGIAGALQFAALGFLVFKRWQILGFRDRHDA